MRYLCKFGKAAVVGLVLCALGCATGGGEAVRVTQTNDALKGLNSEDVQKLNEIKREKTDRKGESSQDLVSGGAPMYTVTDYLTAHPEMENGAGDSADYRVGVNDLLEIYVYGENDLPQKGVRVSGDGYIGFPFIGRIKVEGLTPSEIGTLIARKLSEGRYFHDAQVSVTVSEYKSKKYTVLGSVSKPGNYPLLANDTLLDALSSAGGVNFEEAGRQAIIVRTEGSGKGGDRKVAIKIDLDALLKGTDQRSNIKLAEKDTIYVPKAELFYIMGQVNRPGSYKLAKDMTIVEAIGMAGGFTKIAAPNKTRIIRSEDGVDKVIEVRVKSITESGKKAQDMPIKGSDIIVVPESFF